MRTNEKSEALKSVIESGIKVEKQIRKATGFYMQSADRNNLGERGCSFTDIAKYYASSIPNMASARECALIDTSEMTALSDEIEAIFTRKGAVAAQRLEKIADGVYYCDATDSGWALASKIDIPKIQRTPVFAANIARLASTVDWRDEDKFTKVWDKEQTKPVEVVFSDCWDDEKTLVVSATDGLQSMSIRFLAALSKIRRGEITVDECVNSMFIQFSMKIDARGLPRDEVKASWAKAFGAQENKTEIENSVIFRGHKAFKEGSTMRLAADSVSDYLNKINPGMTIVDNNDFDHLHGNTVASDSDIFLKVINRFHDDELDFGAVILRKLYAAEDSVTFNGDIGINDFNIANMVVRFIQTQYQLKLSTLSAKQRDALAQNCATVLGKMFDKIPNDAKDAANMVKSLLSKQAIDEKDAALGAIRTNHDQLCAQFAVAVLHMNMGAELNSLGNATLSDTSIMKMMPNKTNWEVSDSVKFKFKTMYWGVPINTFAKALELVSMIETKTEVQMVLAKTLSGIEEMPLINAQNYNLEYELV